jgi:CheY-like chemotaxis protein
MKSEEIKVLVVDDEEAHTYVTELDRPGVVDCLEARTVIEGISVASKQSHVECVIMDMNLPLAGRNRAFDEPQRVWKAFDDFASGQGYQPHFDGNKPSIIGGLWCAAYLVEHLPSIDREAILFTSAYVRERVFEHLLPFTKTTKLGVLVRDRLSTVEASKQLIEGLGSRRFISWIESKLVDETLDLDFVRRCMDAFDEGDFSGLSDTYQLQRFFPYSGESGCFYDRAWLLSQLGELASMPKHLPPDLVTKCRRVYSDTSLRREVQSAAAEILAEIVDKRIVFCSDDEDEPRVKSLKALPSDKIRKETLLAYVAGRSGSRQSGLNECICRLVVIGVFANECRFSDSGGMYLEETKIKDVGFTLGFSKFDSRRSVFEVSGFRKLLNNLGFTADGGRDPLHKAHFLVEEKKWLLEMAKAKVINVPRGPLKRWLKVD